MRYIQKTFYEQEGKVYEWVDDFKHLFNVWKVTITQRYDKKEFRFVWLVKISFTRK